MEDSGLFAGGDEVVETEDGFTTAPLPDDSLVDSEIDFDDEQYTDREILIDAPEAGNAEEGEDAHLDDPAEAAAEDEP